MSMEAAKNSEPVGAKRRSGIDFCAWPVVILFRCSGTIKYVLTIGPRRKGYGLMERNMLIAILMIVISLICSGMVAGSPIINGDFSATDDLYGYKATGDFISEPTGEFAQLETDGNLERTLEQAFTIPSIPTLFSFDFAFSTVSYTTPTGVFADSFASSIITLDGDFLDIMVVDSRGVIPDPGDIPGAMPIDVMFDDNTTIDGFAPLSEENIFHGRISLWLPYDILGEEATFYFDLYDQADDFMTIAAVDNISAEPIPEPGTLVLLCTGLIGIAGGFCQRRFVSKRRIHQSL